MLRSMQLANGSARPAPRIVIAGASGDAGKTTVALGLCVALRRRGVRVQAFKKGPDFIDPAWLSRASGSVARNLDVHLCGEDVVRRVFSAYAPSDGISVIEGNRGLFDGGDARGTHSTAALARMLAAPVVLVVNATKVTRTLAAIVLGCRDLEAKTPLAGVVLNRVAGDRHGRVAREAIETETGIRVVGVLRKAGEELIPNRHLGLLTPQEHAAADAALEAVAGVVSDGVDLAAVEKLAGAAPAWADERWERAEAVGRGVRVGVLRDSAFTFYYPENLEAIERAGGTIESISPLADTGVGDIDVLYVGGGFPETHAAALSGNRELLGRLRERARAGMPVYAECGGLMYVSAGLWTSGGRHEMAGLLPVETRMGASPVGHGYVDVEVVAENPFLRVGARFKGHEFHYSSVKEAVGVPLVFEMRRGRGIMGTREGMCLGNVLATYVHVHALGVGGWAEGIVGAGERWRRWRMTR
jgi:cobyrinic acid a,c-diamide synthase